MTDETTHALVTSPVPVHAHAAARDLLDVEGVDPGSCPAGSRRTYVGGFALDAGELRAVAVVDVDAAGTASVRGVAGEVGAMTGLADTLRASGARRLISRRPIAAAGADGWAQIGAEAPLWVLEL
jgi:hypothetical protein